MKMTHTHTHTHTHTQTDTHTETHRHTHCILRMYVVALSCSSCLILSQTKLHSCIDGLTRVSPVQSVAHRYSISGHTLNITSSVISTAEVLCTAVTVQSMYRPFGHSLPMCTYLCKFVCVFMYLAACCECTDLPPSTLPHPLQLPSCCRT